MGHRAATILLMAAALAGAPVRGALPADQAEIARQFIAAYNKATQGDCASAMTDIDPLLKSPVFAAMPEDARQDGYGLAANCEMILGKSDLGYAHALAATKLEGPNAVVWRMRLGVEVQKKDAAAALVTIEAMAPRHQDAVNAIPINWFYTLDRMLRDKPDLPARRRLLSILSKPDYVPDQIGYNGDKFRQSYAAMLVEAGSEGDKATAAQLVSQITDPFALLGMSVDPRLSALMPASYDARATFEGQIARLRDVAASHPGSLGVVLQIELMLRVVGRPAEALATLEASRPDASQGNDFADSDDMRNWWWNGMAYSYAMLGRYDEAVAAFRSGVAVKEHGRMNVSQTINLSHVQLLFGHPKDALATLAPFDGDQGLKTSPYGAMAMRDGRGCARFRSGDIAGAKADLDYALAHERDAADTVTDLQLCMNDADGAAASLIRRLNNPDQRADALKQLSDYDPPLATLPPDPSEKVLDAVKARPDVKAAIARAGGVRRFKLQSYAL